MESERTAGGKLRASWKGWLESPERLGTLVTLLLVILVGLFAASAYLLLRQRAATLQAYRAMTRHHESIRLIDQLHQSSDDLTRMVRSYAVTGNPTFREHFYSILDIRDGRAPRPPGYDIFFWDFVVAGDLPPPGGAEGARVSMREFIERAGASDEEEIRGRARLRPFLKTTTEPFGFRLAEPAKPGEEQ